VLLLASSALEAIRLHTLKIALPLAPGGMLGAVTGDALTGWFGFTGATLLLLTLIATGFSLFSGLSWLRFVDWLGASLETAWQRARLAWQTYQDRRIGAQAMSERGAVVEEEKKRVEEHQPIHIEMPLFEVVKSARAKAEKQTSLFADMQDSPLPPLHLLDQAAQQVEVVSPVTLDFTSRLIERKLKDFGVEVKVVAAYPGPVITRYEIEPAVGVKGSQITNLVKDLARALSVVSIRLVETIPGRAYMALELPNAKRQMVRLSEILSSQVYADMGSILTIAMGKDISGKPVVADLAKMPHVLVAGTTGSGKSVAINAMILSLLYKGTPQQVRLLLIDPKMLELSVYEGIPHLLAPVVTDMRQAASALNWCVQEMDRRYRLMSTFGVRNIAGYNQRVRDAVKAGQPLTNPFHAHTGKSRGSRRVAADRGVHRRTCRHDDGGRQEGRGTGRAPGAEGARFGHPSGAGHAAPFGGCDHRIDQGQRADARGVPGFEQDRFAHHPRSDGCGNLAGAGRYAVSAARHRLSATRARRVRVRSGGASRCRISQGARRTAIHRWCTQFTGRAGRERGRDGEHGCGSRSAL